MVMMRAPRGIFSPERALGIAGAVEEFVVMQDHFPNARERHEGFENFCAEKDVGLHGVPFFGIKRAALVEDGFGNADFADVV